jgi:hypothetical protein
MKLKYVTFTGTDDKTDLSEVQRISKEYPFVEWGMLLSIAKAGSQRYPSKKNFIDINNLKINKSIHICGATCKSIVEEGILEDNMIELFNCAMPHANRCQLNFSIKNTNVDLANLFWFIAKFTRNFILQQNKTNSPFIKGISPYVTRSGKVEILFDCSGGSGSVISEIPNLIPNIFCGYAGGLNPENLESKLQEIEAVVEDNEIWIDMESGVRTNNEFDLKKLLNVVKFLKNIQYDINSSQ